MSELNQRSLATLGELADEPVEQTGPTSDFVYIDISSIDRETKKITEAKALTLSQAPSRAKQLLRTGDVLVSMTRPNLNAVALVPEQLDGAIGSTGFHVLRSRWLRPEFLLRLVQSQRFVYEMSALVQGALYPAVRPKDIAAFTFAFDTPAQQTRIVAKLEELLSDLDAGVAELKAAQKKLAQYRQSLLKAAVVGALTAEWRKQHPATESGAQLLARILQERRARWEAKQLGKFAEQGKTPPKDWQKKYPEPVQPDTTDLPELSEGWVWASLDMLAEKIVDGTHHTPTYTESGVPFISVKDIRDGQIHFDDCKFVSEETHADLIKRCYPNKGDLLVTKSGTIGRTAIVQDEKDFSLFVSVALVKPSSVQVNVYWIDIAFQAWLLSINIANDVKGTAVKNLHLEDFRLLPIPIPPLNEQIEIENKFLSVWGSGVELYQAIDRSLKQSTAQRQNILRAAFAGQLVPQDPNDEPASVLLERIRAERAQRAATPKARGRKV